MMIRWAICKHSDKYEVSELGQVINRCTGKILKNHLTTNGYYDTSIYVGKKQKHFLIHRLIAEHFIPNPNNLLFVNHIDGNKLNNKLSNLEWVTSSENALHSVRTGLSHVRRGIEHHRNAFSNEDILDIRNLLKTGLSQSKIAKMYNVSQTAISKIKLGKRWAHI